MTKEDWLTVAMIIAVILTAAATLFGPVAAVIVQARISQPKPEPKSSQSRRFMLRLDDWLMRHRLFFFILGLVGSFFLFTWGVYRSRRIMDTMSVFLIAYSISAINVCITFWLHFQLVGVVIQIIKKIKDSNPN